MTRLTYAESMVALMAKEDTTVVVWGDPILDECYAEVNPDDKDPPYPPYRWKLIFAGLGRRPDLFKKGKIHGCTFINGSERVVTKYRLLGAAT